MIYITMMIIIFWEMIIIIVTAVETSNLIHNHELKYREVVDIFIENKSKLCTKAGAILFI
jgi:hypothetical protein